MKAWDWRGHRDKGGGRGGGGGDAPAAGKPPDLLIWSGPPPLGDRKTARAPRGDCDLSHATPQCGDACADVPPPGANAVRSPRVVRRPLAVRPPVSLEAALLSLGGFDAFSRLDVGQAVTVEEIGPGIRAHFNLFTYPRCHAALIVWRNAPKRAVAKLGGAVCFYRKEQSNPWLRLHIS